MVVAITVAAVEGGMVEDPLPKCTGLHFYSTIDLPFGNRMHGSISNAIIFILSVNIFFRMHE